jgi:hypothetical protein
VFDLELLLRRHRDAVSPGVMEEPQLLDLALERALELPYEAFRNQVVPFLDPEVVELYDNQEAWEEMQTFVAERLSELR